MLRLTDKKLGFTIVELLVVIVVLGILTTIGIVSWRGVQDRAYNTERLNELKGWENIFTLYASQEHKYPSVPDYGGYCLGTGFPTKAQIDAKFDTWSSPPPASQRWPAQDISSPAPGYCRSIMSYGSSNWYARQRVNTALNTQLTSVGKAPDNKQFGGNYDWIITPYVDYQASRVRLYQAFIGSSCPPSTTNDGSAGTNITLCYIELPTKYSFDITP